MSTKDENVTTTYYVEVSRQTYVNKDLLFVQALRQLIDTFQPHLDEGQIDTLLRAESNRPRPTKGTQ